MTKTAKPKKVDADKKARTKKLLIAAGAVALTAAAAYGVHRYKRANTNLIQLAKNTDRLNVNSAKKALENLDKKKSSAIANVKNTAKASASSMSKHNSGSKKILETRKQALYKDNANKALANLEAMKKAVNKNSDAVKKAMNAFDQLDSVVRQRKKK